LEVGVSTDAGLVWHPELQLDAAAALLEPEEVKCSGGRGGPALTVTPGGWLTTDGSSGLSAASSTSGKMPASSIF